MSAACPSLPAAAAHVEPAEAQPATAENAPDCIASLDDPDSNGFIFRGHAQEGGPAPLDDFYSDDSLSRRFQLKGNETYAPLAPAGRDRNSRIAPPGGRRGSLGDTGLYSLGFLFRAGMPDALSLAVGVKVQTENLSPASGNPPAPDPGRSDSISLQPPPLPINSTQ